LLTIVIAGGIYGASAAQRDSDVIAVAVLLEPEVAMVRYAQGVFDDLQQTYPERYSGELAPCPRITLAQQFVRVADLPAMIDAVAEVAAHKQAGALQLITDGYTYGYRNPAGLGVMSLNVEVGPRLRNFEYWIVDAVEPFAVRGRDDAFAVPVTMQTVNWVERFVPVLSGENFTAELPVAVVPTEYLKAMKARPFLPLTFGATGVAIYQLGSFAAVQERIWDSGGINPCACPYQDPGAEFIAAD
jgi:hypothetical protein